MDTRWFARTDPGGVFGDVGSRAGRRHGSVLLCRDRSRAG